MSVLYKALQKAAKDNEQQAADPADVPESNAFDPERLAGAGSISGKKFGGGDNNLKLAGGAAAVVLLLVVVGFFVLGGPDEPAPVQVAQAPTPAVQPDSASETPASPPAAPAQTPMDVAREAAQPGQMPAQTAGEQQIDSVATTGDVVVAATEEAPPSSLAEGQAEATASNFEAGADTVSAAAVNEDASEVMASNGGSGGAASDMASSSAANEVQSDNALLARATEPAATTSLATVSSDPAAPASAATAPISVSSDPMPQLDANSPARALSPPISIRRAEAEFAGVGNLVTVREVSQSAQDNVTAGYNALVRGDIGLALELYTAAIESEPTSVLAQLGRGAALQKLGRMEEARGGYENVLRLDPNNREALTNLTSIYSARAPNEALSRLLDLEREYPSFSPVKAQIGLLYARMGSTADALAYLRQAATLDPGTVMYQYNLAVLLDRMGRAEQAVLSYERVLAGIISGGAAGNLSRAGIERRVRYLKTL